MSKYDKYLSGLTMAKSYNFKDKEKALSIRVSYMLARLCAMFKYEGLPDTIPQRMLELYLLNNGHCVVTKVEDKLYAFWGSFGGELDEYYRPTIYVVSNPYLHYYKDLEIDKDCILCGNDSVYMGLLPMLEMYGTALVENELSMQIADINSRIIALITADNDTDAENAREFLKKIIAGDLSAIAESAFFDGIRTQPYATEGANRLITDLIEYEQYLKASLYNEIGLNANYNMKRESLNTSESQLNNDALTPLIDNMLNMRKQFVDKINNMFGTNITVDFASAWKENKQEASAELEAITGETENVSHETLTDEPEETKGEDDERKTETD